MKRKPRQGLPHYTYRQFSKEGEKLIFKRMVMVSAASVVLIAVIWFWGTSFVSLLGFLAKPTKESPPEVNLNFPIIKPILEDIPEATSSEKISVEGRTTPNQEVTLVGTEGEVKTTADKDGSFQFKNISLKKGLNLLKVYVVDSSGNKLEESFVITFDDTPPFLDLYQPKDGQIFPKNTQSIKVSGKTEAEAEVYVNELQAIVDPQGQFLFNYPAKKGPQKLEAKAVDTAGNSKKIIITVVVSGG